MVIPLGLEPGGKSAMKQRPVKPDAPILNKYMISRIILVALSMAGIALGLYAYFIATHGAAYAQTIVFVALVAIQWANAINARSTYQSAFTRIFVRHPIFWIGLTISISLQWFALFGPLQELLHIYPIAVADMLVVSACAFVAIILVVEVHKFVGRRLVLTKVLAE